MFRDLKVRGFLIFLVVLAAAYKIYPTYQYYTMSDESKAQMAHGDMKQLRSDSINLGLDLQGGMYVLLEAEIPTLVRKLASKKPDDLMKTITDAEQRSTNLQTDFFDEFETLANNRELRLIRYYTNLSTSRDNGSVINALKLQRDDAVSSALEIIRNRGDEFGVAEPNIQKYGKNTARGVRIKQAEMEKKAAKRKVEGDHFFVKGQREYSKTKGKWSGGHAKSMCKITCRNKKHGSKKK